MEEKRYYFPKFSETHPKRNLSMVSKQLMSQHKHISYIFRKYAANSCPQSPRHILFLMTQQTESLFEEIEKEHTFGINWGAEPSILVKSFPSLSSLKQKILTSEDSAKSTNLETDSSSHETVLGSFKKKGSSTDSKGEVSRSRDETPESSSAERMDKVVSGHTAVPKHASPLKTAKEDVKPSTKAEESVSCKEISKIADSSDSGCPEKDLKRPAVSLQEEEEASNPAKRPKLSDSSVTDNPEFVTTGKEAEISIHSAEDDKMAISPDTADKTKDSSSKAEDDKMNISPDEADKTKDGSSKSQDHKLNKSTDEASETDDSSKEDEEIIVSSPSKKEALLKMEVLFRSIPILKYKKKKKKKVLSHVSIESEENTGCASINPRTDDGRIESAVRNLSDETSRIENIKKAVEDRIKGDRSLKKTKRAFSPSKKKTSNRSPQKLRKTNSPRKDLTKISGFDDPESNYSNPNVFAYVKKRFMKILSVRTKYMNQVGQSLEDFRINAGFLHLYAKTLALTIDNPIENEDFTDELKNLKDGMLRNSKELSKNFISLINTVKSDIPFWDEGLKEFMDLKNENELLLSEDSSSLEHLRKFESSLRTIWDKMDRRIFLRNGFRSAILKVSEDYIKLIKDFFNYLIMVEVVTPSLIVSSEEVKAK